MKSIYILLVNISCVYERPSSDPAAFERRRITLHHFDTDLNPIHMNVYINIYMHVYIHFPGRALQHSSSS